MGSIATTSKPNVYRLIVDAGTDPATGRRRQRTRTFHGGKREARAAMEAWQVEVRKAATVTATRSTFADLHARYMEREIARGRSGSTIRGRETAARRYLLPNLGHIPLAALTSEHLDGLYTRLLTQPQPSTGKPLGASYVRILHTQIKATLALGVAWEWIPSNVAARVQPPSVPHKPVTSPGPDAVAAVLDAIRAADPTLYLFVELVASTGMRPGEACAITWDRLDWETGCLTLDRSVSRGEHAGPVLKSTKTGNLRRVHLPQPILDLLRTHLDRHPDHYDSGHLFSHDPRGIRPWRSDYATHRIRRIAKPLGHGDVNPRALRHYVATQLLTANVDVRTVAGILGHANPAMTLNVYAAFIPSRGAEALAALHASRPAVD